MNTEDGPPIAGGHDYFVPMVDMLAGVIFILVILLAAVSLVSRDEFARTQEAQAEISRIETELAAAKAAETRYLDPRREAEAALRLLLQRVRDDLAAAGRPSTISADGRRLSIAAEDAFAAATLQPDPAGLGLARVLAGTMRRELPCVSSGLPRDPAACAGYPAVQLDSIGLRVTGDAAASLPNGARALGLLSALVASEPELLALRAPGGAALVGYRENAGTPGSSAESGLRIEIDFQMLLPAIPN